MKKTLVLAGLMLTLAASNAAAQAALPVTNKPQSLGSFVEAIRKNDRRVLNIDCMKYVESYNKTFKPEVPIADCEGLAKEYELLSVDECPAGTRASFTRVMRDGSIDLFGYERECRSGEQWAWSNQSGLWISSLMCGNLISKNELPLPRQHVEVAPPTPVQEPLPPTLTESAREAGRQMAAKARPEPRREFGRGNPLMRFSRWYGRNWWWTTPLTVAAVGGGYCVVKDCFVTEVTQTVTVIH